jgi:hypothetical protein
MMMGRFGRKKGHDGDGGVCAAGTKKDASSTVYKPNQA